MCKNDDPNVLIQYVRGRGARRGKRVGFVKATYDPNRKLLLVQAALCHPSDELKPFEAYDSFQRKAGEKMPRSLRGLVTKLTARAIKYFKVVNEIVYPLGYVELCDEYKSVTVTKRKQKRLERQQKNLIKIELQKIEQQKAKLHYERKKEREL